MPLLGSMRSVSWRYVTGRGGSKLRQASEGVLSGVILSDSLAEAEPFRDIKTPRRLRKLGDDVLRLYFAQWLVDDGLFLDLRSPRFGVQDGTDSFFIAIDDTDAAGSIPYLTAGG